MEVTQGRYQKISKHFMFTVNLSLRKSKSVNI